MLKELLQMNSQIDFIGLSGIVDNKFYHTVFIPMEMKYQAFALFDNGTHIEIKNSKGKGDRYSYFNYADKRYIFNTQDHLWFQGNVVNAVNANGVQNFLDNQIPELNILYDDLKSCIKNYYDFVNEDELDIVICHIIHSYLLGLLGKTFYLLLDGEKNTGKSTLQNVIAKLEYHGCFAGKSSIAAIVRKIHFLRSSIHLDEFEKLGKDEKSIMTGVLNTGAYESGTKEIVNLDAKTNAGQIQIFRTFGTKSFSVNKSSFADSFISRSVLIHTVRNSQPVKSIYGLSQEEKNRFQELTNQLFIVSLKYGKEIAQEIKCKQSELEKKGIFGRRADILAIICGIKRYFTLGDEALFNYLKGKEDLEEDDETYNDRSYFTYKYLLRIAKNCDKNFIECSNQELRQYIIDELEIEEFSQFAPTSRSVGSLLKRLKLVCSKNDYKRQGGRGNIVYLIPKERLNDIISRTGFKDLINELAEITFTPSQIDGY